MSKKLLLALAIITALMIGGSSLTKDDSKKEPVKAKLSLKDMVGKTAPDFSLTNQSGQKFSLSGLRGKKIVLFFNEGIMCYPACWNQMAALGADGQLNNDDTISFSIVTDSPDQWTSAFKKMPELGSGNILFDSNRTVSNQYDMLTAESSMHRGSMPGHTYLILDKNGIIKYTLDDPTMGIQNEKLISELQKI